ncbi:MAG: hypothetical protein IPP98_01790 [Gemmatimonadetes bacterium]|nr:hypothetical protein [Gemmatimonadota bacterium]
MSGLAREVAGIRFANPVLLASGTAGYGRELLGVADLSCLGGLVTKAVSLAPRAWQCRATRRRVPRGDAQLDRARQSRRRSGCARRAAVAPRQRARAAGAGERRRLHDRGVCRGHCAAGVGQWPRRV